MGKILAVCTSEKKGTSKKNAGMVYIKKNHGIVGDAHAGKWHRQVSLLAKESMDEIRRSRIGCGGFGENLTTYGIELTSLVTGTKLKVGKNVILEVTQIGKTCKKPCDIYRKLGNCILPSQGIFTKVLKGGSAKQNDEINLFVNGRKMVVGVLTVSDRCAQGGRKDESGEYMKSSLNKILNCYVARYKIVPDESQLIAETLKKWSDEGYLDLIFTSGGTGFSPRDVTPEATRNIIEKETPGIAEIMRVEGARKTKRAYLSRGTAGIRNKTLIINLPGSSKGVKESIGIITPLIPHAVEVMKGAVKDCGHTKSG